jgi:hypothetical protein
MSTLIQSYPWSIVAFIVPIEEGQAEDSNSNNINLFLPNDLNESA